MGGISVLFPELGCEELVTFYRMCGYVLALMQITLRQCSSCCLLFPHGVGNFYLMNLHLFLQNYAEFRWEENLFILFSLSLALGVWEPR